MPSSRSELIKKFLLTNHLSVNERNIFIEEPLQTKEASDAIYEALLTHRFFPPVTRQWNKNTFYYEGFVIESQGEKYILHEQAAGATMNLIHSSELVYTEIDKVIEAFLEANKRIFASTGIILEL